MNSNILLHPLVPLTNNQTDVLNKKNETTTTTTTQYTQHTSGNFWEKIYKNQNLVTKTLHTLHCSGFYQVFFCVIYVLYYTRLNIYGTYQPTINSNTCYRTVVFGITYRKKNNLCIVAATTEKNIEENILCTRLFA